MQNWLKRLDIKIVILSRGRYSTISTNKLLPDFIEIVVPDDEVELYKKTVKNPIISIPNELEGLGKVRNWCLNTFKEEIVIMIDDDISACYNLERYKARKILDKMELLEVLINTAIMAKDAGVGCFGYTQTDIRKYNGTKPFSLCTWVGGVIGVIGKNIKFRDDKFKVDIDFCLQNLMLKRIIWCDNRYCLLQKRDCNAGGNSSFRTLEGYKQSTESLKKKWGKYINVKEKVGSQIKITLNVKRKQQIEIE